MIRTNAQRRCSRLKFMKKNNLTRKEFRMFCHISTLWIKTYKSYLHDVHMKETIPQIFLQRFYNLNKKDHEKLFINQQGEDYYEANRILTEVIKSYKK